MKGTVGLIPTVLFLNKMNPSGTFCPGGIIISLGLIFGR